MTFVFPILLGGLALAGIPVLLHLIVRQKPKRLPFPAFRFLVQQRRSNLRKLRLRQLLLLALRVFLIAAMCLLLARPRLFQRVLGLDGERPVNAVLLFDTSASMEYRSSDGLTRLDDARQRGRELLDELPAGSKVAIVDSADARVEKAAEWLSLNDARQRLGKLKIRPANAPVTQALLKALACFEQGESDKPGRAGPPRLRLLAVLSDWTKASWDGSQVPALIDKLDAMPPIYEGLLEARSQLGSLQEMVRELPQQLPAESSKNYNEQALLDALTALQDDLAGLRPEADSWPESLSPSLQRARRLVRELRVQLPSDESAPNETAQAFRGKLRSALAELLRTTGGVQLLPIGVGMESPVDLAVVQLELPRIGTGLEQHVFAAGEPFTLQAHVQATGKDQPTRVICVVGTAQVEFKINEVKAGAPPQVVPFKIGEAPLLLKPGDNSIEVRLDTTRDPPPLNHRRFATVRVRPKRKVLVLVDDPDRQGSFAKALAALGYAPELRTAGSVTTEPLGYAAVYMLGVSAPEKQLWESLEKYVRKGGGLGIVPAGNDLAPQAYNKDAAQKLMPGKIEIKSDETSEWNWEPRSAKYAHSFMKQFKVWRENPRFDIVVYPRSAFSFWNVTPRPGESLVLVEYDAQGKSKAPGKPAVLDRVFDAKSGMQGKVLLLTTPLDKQEVLWHNYLEDVTEFYLELLMQATGYLAGETVPPQLNFMLGHGDPVVALGAMPALAAPPTLSGPFGAKPLEPGETRLVLRDLAMPGNYVIDGKVKESGELRRLAGFSLNIPSEECDLSRVASVEIERLFPADALLKIDRERPLHDMLQSYRNAPLDLMPYLMLALLFALAIENLLANRFYRQSAAAG
jgi:hypothetical protein